MSDQSEVLTRLLKKFINELMEKLPRAEIDELRREVTSLEARLVRVEAAMDRLSPGLVPSKPGRRINRVRDQGR